MRATELFEGLFSCPIPDADVRCVTERADQAVGDSVFVCVRGYRNDGHDFAARAYENGCRIFVAERPLSLPDDACVLLCDSTRYTLGHLACRFYGHPSHTLRVIGITGTKGKTTTAVILRDLLCACGIPCGYIGTNGIRYREIQKQTNNTTPDAMTLQSTLADMLHSGMQAAVIEVSSQALMQFRAVGTQFAGVLFTNLYRDHVGEAEHPTFENYRACKHALFTDFSSSVAIFNEDDAATSLMKEGCRADRMLGVSTDRARRAAYTATDLTFTRDPLGLGMRFFLHTDKESHAVSLPMVGAHNVSNAMMALATARECFGLSLSAMLPSLQSMHTEGRAECLPLPSGALCVIDYAHNGESLRSLLTALRVYRPRRLICLFGSVGERSQLRRRALGEVAAELADLSILTSDNPGREDPEAIIREISLPFEEAHKPYLVCVDRADAIRMALSGLGDGDILVLAGKGHERYQLIGTEKRPFCEREIVLSAIADVTVR